MININYQSFGQKFGLRLRLYQDGETRYINVNKLLQGNLLKKHWNQKKQMFVPSAPFSKENNEVLVNFKCKYEQRAMNWTGSLAGFMATVDCTDSTKYRRPTVHSLFQRIIDEYKGRKHEDGTVKGSYEVYEKCERKIMEYCQEKRLDYDNLEICDLTSDFINLMFYWIKDKKKGKGFVNLSKMLHAALNMADKWGLYDFSKIKGVEWAKKPRSSSQKYHTLTPAQCNKLKDMDPKELPRSRKKLFYRDFCLFLLYSGQSPCDAIALRYSDIQNISGTEHFVFRRRKIAEKQSVPCCVPINDAMRAIMKRWKSEAKDGYVFPIRTKEKLKNQTTNNGDIKHFIGKLNVWLKKLGVVLGCDFPLHIYTFRHTSITNYVSKGIPVIYVANMMGTSVKNCEQIYYNNRGDTASMNKVLGLVSF